MITIFIKYMFIIFSGLYSSFRLSNERLSFSSTIRIITVCAIVILQAILVAFIRQYTQIISIVVMITTSIFVSMALLKVETSTAIVVTMLGYGISYLLYLCGAIILGIVKTIIQDNSVSINLLSVIFIGAFQVSLSILFFRTKRLRHGLPFLSDSKYSDLGVYLCVSVLLVATILGVQSLSERTIIALFFLLICLGVVLGYWWKKYLIREYLEHLQKAKHKELENTVAILENKIETLSKENETFSKLIHKDNKLIPAMELAVSQLLYSIAQDDNEQSRMEQAQSILKQLKALSEERAGIVKNYEDASQKLPCLGLNGLDALFLFMLQRAHMSEIEFDLKLDDGIDQIITGNISESDVSTLLADLIENALIAANHTEHKKAVQVKLSAHAGIFYISVSDSGPPFPPEVLERWGIERITTHADTGGSGIGMMTIYELCQKYSASFEIEQVQNVSPYRKCVSIRFDGLCSFRLR